MNEEIIKIIACFIFGWDLYIYKYCVAEDIKCARRTKKEPIVLLDIFLVFGLFILIVTAYDILSGDKEYMIFIVMYTIYVYTIKFGLKE